MNQERNSQLSSIKIPLLVDVGVICSIIFGGGIMWQKVDALALQVGELRASVADSTPQAQDRLARIEERLIGLQAQMTELKSEVRKQNR